MRTLKFWKILLSSCLFVSSAQAAELKLKNGTSFIVEQDTRSPRDLVMLSFLGGNGLIKPEEQGVGRILASILNEGPAGLSSTEFRKQLFLLGGEIQFSTSTRSASVTLVAPSDKLELVMALALDTLKKPKFDEATYQLARSKVEAALAQREDDMGSTIRYFAMRDAFNYHPDVLDGSPSRVSMKNVNLKTVEKAQPLLFDAHYLMTAAVGPSEPQALQKLIDTKLAGAGMLDKPVGKRKFQSARKNQKPKGPVKVVVLNRAGASDNQVRYVVRRDIPLDNSDLVALNLATKLLGGGMQSSLFKVLRAERGLTYSAGAGTGENLGFWTVASFASTDKIGKLMSGINEVVTNQSKVVVDKAEADLVKGDLLTEWRESRELPSDRLSSDVTAKVFDRDPKFQETMDQWIAKTPESAITAKEKEYFNLKDAYVYVMGDKTKLLPILKTLGYKDKEVKVVEVAGIL